jgi:hypothetical protein
LFSKKTLELLLEAIRCTDGKFPRNELHEIIERKEEAIPYLLQIMNGLKEDYTKVIDGGRFFMQTYFR